MFCNVTHKPFVAYKKRGVRSIPRSLLTQKRVRATLVRRCAGAKLAQMPRGLQARRLPMCWGSTISTPQGRTASLPPPRWASSRLSCRLSPCARHAQLAQRVRTLCILLRRSLHHVVQRRWLDDCFVSARAREGCRQLHMSSGNAEIVQWKAVNKEIYICWLNVPGGKTPNSDARCFVQGRSGA